jgi:hypothetical protein
MAKTGKAVKAAQVTNIIAGAKKHFPNGSQELTVGGATLTVDQATAKMQVFVDNRDAVDTAQANATAKVAAERAQTASLLAFIAAFVTYVRLTFDNAPDVLADFDIPPPKVRTPMTAAAKAIAAAKREATRAARGTTSKKAKKNVKGNITAALVVTPVASSAPTAPVAAPTPAATGNVPSGGTPTPTAHS